MCYNHLEVMIVKKIRGMPDARIAKAAANFMKYICYLAVLLFICGLVLSFIGRQTFVLHTSEGVYDRAIYVEKSHVWTTRGPTVYLKDDILVTTDKEIDLITQIGISAMFAASSVPLIVCLWLLGRLFKNVSEGRIFTEQNAKVLLYYGVIRIARAIPAPLAKRLICHIANQFTASQITISARMDLINDLLPNIAFIVAAYIISHGIHLQDEADHTL